MYKIHFKIIYEINRNKQGFLTIRNCVLIWSTLKRGEPKILQRALSFQCRDNCRIAPIDGPKLPILQS